MPTYVKAPGKDTWHWCSGCNNYPSSIDDKVSLPGKQRPSSGELCDTCLGKERNGTC